MRFPDELHVVMPGILINNLPPFGYQFGGSLWPIARCQLIFETSTYFQHQTLP